MSFDKSPLGEYSRVAISVGLQVLGAASNTVTQDLLTSSVLHSHFGRRQSVIGSNFCFLLIKTRYESLHFTCLRLPKPPTNRIHLRLPTISLQTQNSTVHLLALL